MAKMATWRSCRTATEVYTYADVLAIISHEEMFKKKGWKPPTTWADLMRPELKGTVIIPPVSNTYGLYTLVELARMGGGSEDNIEPGFVALKKVAPNVVDLDHDLRQDRHADGKRDGLDRRVRQRLGLEIRGKGIPVNVVIPQPAWREPDRRRHREGKPRSGWRRGAAQLADRRRRCWPTAPSASAIRPMNKDVKVSDKAKDRVLTGDQLNNLAKLDYSKVLANRADWNARFEREVATIK